ncbi:TIM barrel protein [Pectinatus sottacetonis]|uniref:TIM barrel protein n=1 Tax=Pectinatus sottacetonis TaxID=1002795 RepID=UPI0018C46998|nr:TIM barrel protein [Pectinatus sottacetonis]
MKNLLNYCSINCYEKELVKRKINLAQYIEHYNLSGIEQFIYCNQLSVKSYASITIGVHLAYWPQWLDFWRGKSADDIFILKNMGINNVNVWLEIIRENIYAALKELPEYLVWHIADCSPEEAYTFKFRYSDDDVITAAAEVFNEVADCIPDSVLVLFENLWWPGLRLLDAKTVEKFFALVNKKNVGIMLDTGHLINTNPNIEDEQEAVAYIYKVILQLGDTAKRIKGMHLNCSLSGSYQRSFSRKVPADNNYSGLIKHIISIDQHKPFTQDGIRKIFNVINPEYVTHELIYNDFTDLGKKLSKQMKACGRFWHK